LRGFVGIVALLVVFAASSTSDAAARRVTVLVVTGPQPPAVRSGGAVGLYIAGKGLYVSRQEALERLGIDDFVDRTCGTLQRCPIEVFVSVPALGAHRNVRRYDVTIRGEGYSGVLESDRTRIDGLLAIEDVGETVRALERGDEPPVRARPSSDAAAELDALDRRLDSARRAQGPATWALAFVAIALTSLALVTREPVVARGALAYPLLAVLAAVAIAGLDATGPGATTLGVIGASSLALAIVRVRGDVFGLVLAGAIAAYGLVLVAAPEANALAGIGPHPWNGGRFHGVTNQIETLLLPAALAAGAALGGWRLAAVGALTLVVVGTSRTGADGGGLLVCAVAFAVLWLRTRGGRLSPGLVAAAVAAVAVTVVADALTGGTSHVVDTVRSGPDALWDAFARRLRLSWAIVTSTVFQFAVFVAGLGVIVWFATRRPRTAIVEAFVAGIGVSLLVNDSPTKVAGFGAVACAALYAWAVSATDEPGIQSPT